jgi:DNA-binding MarR family transcriptional regulator
VLVALGDGPVTQRELAGRCQVQDQTVSRVIDGLERGGYACRDLLIKIITRLGEDRKDYSRTP